MTHERFWSTQVRLERKLTKYHAITPTSKPDTALWGWLCDLIGNGQNCQQCGRYLDTSNGTQLQRVTSSVQIEVVTMRYSILHTLLSSTTVQFYFWPETGAVSTAVTREVPFALHFRSSNDTTCDEVQHVSCAPTRFSFARPSYWVWLWEIKIHRSLRSLLFSDWACAFPATFEARPDSPYLL